MVIKRHYIISLIIIGFIIIVEVIFVGRTRLRNSNHDKPVRILLLGASVGEEWNFPNWPRRMGKDGFLFEMVPFYSFNKDRAIEEILIRPKRKIHFNKTFLKSLFKPAPKKPDIVIIKECAAYFPGDFKKYQDLVNKWIEQLRQAGIKPVLATVIPVTEEHSRTKPGRLEGIIKYNDWLRRFAKNKNIYCLDLEEALRISDNKRFLRPDLANTDGLHLNQKAYKILDLLISKKLRFILSS